MVTMQMVAMATELQAKCRQCRAKRGNERVKKERDVNRGDSRNRST